MEKEENCIPHPEPREGSLLTALISGFVAGVTATVAMFKICKKE